MALLSEPDRQRLREALDAMPAPVRLMFFTQTLGCETCLLARQILDELVSLSARLTLEEVNLVLDKDKAAAWGIDRVPAIVVAAGGSDEVDARGLRFYGAPSGYEFMSLLDAVMLVSGLAEGAGEPALSDESLELLAGVDQAVDLQVFVTPT
ncbi:MAG: hypothetical protein KGN76_13040 [Acidobacteriota bacterium]|nr:hypothetical protein [Acidobacteriota bacterium]